MPPPPAELHERMRLTLEQMAAAAMRADPAGAETVLANVPADRYTAHLVRHARRNLLATAVALGAVLEVHRYVPGPHRTPVCRSCGTSRVCPTVRRIAEVLAAYLPGPVELDRAEAWRRAENALAASGASVLVGIQEIPGGHVAWPAPWHYQARQHPTGREHVLIVDKRTGRLTRWPALPLDRLATEYTRSRENRA
ncbi:hypothetical protein DPM19_24545 [Actinomadura craniellae]|uniref:Uncharacterized protein n=1 Tax=Actinomadura craniellae TaxID=2231787 RepID=A0A365GZY2_9ACTN|nr:hypothetical protein [Actinomadura craniellae]RAY12328.1 hypothetical protein DPM19_24545 [Actinomadura craniellae]